MIKQLLNLNWLSQNVVFVRVLHIIMGTIILLCTTTWGQKIVQHSLHKSFITCMMTSACFFSHVGKVEKMCWAEVKHSHSNTTASISFRVNRIVQSILPNLLRLPPWCNPYCLRNSFILSPCRVETVLCWFKAFLTGCHYSLSHTLHHLHIYTLGLFHFFIW